LRTAAEIIRLLFGPRRWWQTLLVLAAALVMVRLGFWQLDRLAQRRARNAQIRAQMTAPPLNLNTDPIPGDLASVRYRRVLARGRFDFSHQFALKNRTSRRGAGVDLITPLILDGRDGAVLVDRGWIPYENANPLQWDAFNSPQETVTITGFVGLSAMPPPNLQRPILPDEHRALFYIDPSSLAELVPYPLFPFYIVWMPPQGKEDTTLPLRYSPHYDLSEGPHLGYAIQWFLFAAVVPTVYLFLLRSKRK